MVIFIVVFSIGCSRQPEYPPEIIELKRAVEKSPNDIALHKELIKALYEKEYYKDSLKYSQKLLGIAPEDYYGYLYLGLSNEKLKKWDEAERYYKELCNKFPQDEEGFYRLAVLGYKKGEYKDSIENMEHAIAIGIPDTKTYIEMMNFLALTYYYNNEPLKAYEILEKALELDPFNKDILYNYGVWLLRDGKYEESIQFLNKLISQNPQEEFPYLRIGKSYYHSRQMDLAEKAFWEGSTFDSTIKILAEIVHVQDLYSTYKDINTAVVKVDEKYDYKYGDRYYVRGIIENMGLEVAQNASVIVRIYDKKDNIITQKVFEPSPRNIRPEQYAFFTIDIPYEERISYVKIEPNWHKRSVSIYLK